MGAVDATRSDAVPPPPDRDRRRHPSSLGDTVDYLYSVLLNDPPRFLRRWHAVGEASGLMRYALISPSVSLRVAGERVRVVARRRIGGLTVEATRAATLPLREANAWLAADGLTDPHFLARLGGLRESDFCRAFADGGVPVLTLRRSIEFYRQGAVRAAVMRLADEDVGRATQMVRFASDDPGALRRLIDTAGFASRRDTPVEAWLSEAKVRHPAVHPAPRRRIAH